MIKVLDSPDITYVHFVTGFYEKYYYRQIYSQNHFSPQLYQNTAHSLSNEFSLDFLIAVHSSWLSKTFEDG